MSVSTQHPAQPNASAPGGARTRIRARRRTIGASLGAMPVANIVVIEVGLAIGLILVLVSDGKLFPVAAGVAGLALLIAILRRRGRWFTQWFGQVLEYQTRNHVRRSESPSADASENAEDKDGDGIIGPDENHRVALLRVAVEDLVVARGQDHDRNPVGLAWHEGKWTAVLMVDPTPPLLKATDATLNLPLGVLAPCLEDRGVVLDAIQVIWHCYPGGAQLLPAGLASPSLLVIV